MSLDDNLEPAAHAPFDELAAGHAVHALDAADEARFQEHLDGCERCVVTLFELGGVTVELAGGVPPLEPPARLRAAILAAAAATPQVSPSSDAPPSSDSQAPDSQVPGSPLGLPAGRRRRPRRPAGRVLAAVAAGVVAVLVATALAVWGTVESDRASSRLAALRAQSQVLSQLAQPGARAIAIPPSGGASGRVVIAGQRVYVLTTGLRPNDTADTTYVLWAVVAGKPVGLRAFDATAAPVTVVDVGPVAPSVAAATTFAVSIEPGRTVPAAPSKVVLG